MITIEPAKTTKNQCDNCQHFSVCMYRDKFDSIENEIRNALPEGSSNFIDLEIKCKHRSLLISVPNLRNVVEPETNIRLLSDEIKTTNANNTNKEIITLENDTKPGEYQNITQTSMVRKR